MELSNIVEGYQNDIIKSTQELVRIKSVEEPQEGDMPFGKGPAEALKRMLEMGENLGFKVKNVDNYAGHIEYGEGEEIVGILVHMDVVPEGDGWDHPPYAAEIHDGKIYGRGTVDNKGPGVSSLYALKALKDSGKKINKKIRIILGTNEETNWGGINYYLKKEKAPDVAFTPDADFPLIKGEMGILVFDLISKFKEAKGDIALTSIKGGIAPNVVPDLCCATLKVVKEKQEEVLKALEDHVKSVQDEEIIITTKGVSAHGSTPEKGKNAISLMFNLLNNIHIDNLDVNNFIEVYNQKIGMETNGKSIGCGFKDDLSGELVFNVGKIDLNETEAKITVNIRYPISCTAKEVYAGMEKELEGTNVLIHHIEDMGPINVPEESDLIQTLMKIYQKETGDLESKPLVIGGGTYARALKKAVAFGPVFPGRPCVEHQRNEYISIDDLMKCTKIYAEAIYELAK